jgi:hypothetical protein
LQHYQKRERSGFDRRLWQAELRDVAVAMGHAQQDTAARHHHLGDARRKIRNSISFSLISSFSLRSGIGLKIHDGSTIKKRPSGFPHPAPLLPAHHDTQVTFSLG